jgi:hypothetical protein
MTQSCVIVAEGPASTDILRIVSVNGLLKG